MAAMLKRLFGKDSCSTCALATAGLRTIVMSRTSCFRESAMKNVTISMDDELASIRIGREGRQEHVEILAERPRKADAVEAAKERRGVSKRWRIMAVPSWDPRTGACLPRRAKCPTLRCSSTATFCSTRDRTVEKRSGRRWLTLDGLASSLRKSASPQRSTHVCFARGGSTTERFSTSTNSDLGVVHRRPVDIRADQSLNGILLVGLPAAGLGTGTRLHAFPSEDLQDGQTIEGLTIVDPFAHTPDQILASP